MKSSASLTLAALVATAVFTLPAHAGSCSADKATSAAKTQPARDIVAVASSAGSFNTLVAAVQAAGLVETLQGKGPFTVFAPTDEAFAKLPAGTVESLLLPENRAKLIAILTYHVVPGKVLAADVTTSQAATVNGQKLPLVVANGKVTAGSANVVATDVPASNGVIHVVDSVILPL